MAILPTKLYIKGTATVNKSVEKDLEIKDPEQEEAKATIEKYIKEEEENDEVSGAKGTD